MFHPLGAIRESTSSRLETSILDNLGNYTRKYTPSSGRYHVEKQRKDQQDIVESPHLHVDSSRGGTPLQLN